MTDANLMDAFCKHGKYWDECDACNEITTLEIECQRLVDENTSLQNELERQLDFNQRLMKELSQWGWGDFHYGPVIEQDRDIVALLEEGGFQYDTDKLKSDWDQSTLETRPGSGRDDGIGTTGQETV